MSAIDLPPLESIIHSYRHLAAVRLQEKYGEALGAALDGAPQRAVYFANRAACQLKLKEWGAAASDCTRALEIDPVYLKALARRCAAYQELDDMDRALSDAQKVPPCGVGETHSNNFFIRIHILRFTNSWGCLTT